MDNTGIIIQLLRGLDNGMPQALRPAWQYMTPEFQRQKAQEAAMQQQQGTDLQDAGSDPQAAQEQAELQQYRRSRQ